MNFDHLDITTKKIARQINDFEARSLDPNMEIPQPFAANAEYFFDAAALSEAGIDLMGLARQSDQVLGENLGNNFAQRVKQAIKKGVALPDQSIMDEMVRAYDFTGIRATSEEGMSTEERTIVSEIKKALRRTISSGVFANLDGNSQKTTNPEAVAFNAIRVQTGPEAERKRDKDGNPRITPPGSVPLDNFEEVVAAAYGGGTVEIEDGNGNTATLDFSVEPSINEHGQATNLPGIVELARQEAARTIEHNRKKAAPLTVAVQIG